MNKKTRGFEHVSQEQWDKDTNGTAQEDILELKVIPLPKRGTLHAAAYDIVSPVSCILYPNDTIKIPTGFKAYMLDDEYISFYPRSGLGFKFFTRLANTIGIGDAKRK